MGTNETEKFATSSNAFTSIKMKMTKAATVEIFKDCTIEEDQPKSHTRSPYKNKTPEASNHELSRFKGNKRKNRSHIWNREHKLLLKRMKEMKAKYETRILKCERKISELQTRFNEFISPSVKKLVSSSFTPPKPVDSLKKLKTFEKKLRQNLKSPSIEFEWESNELVKSSSQIKPLKVILR